MDTQRIPGYFAAYFNLKKTPQEVLAPKTVKDQINEFKYKLKCIPDAGPLELSDPIDHQIIAVGWSFAMAECCETCPVRDHLCSACDKRNTTYSVIKTNIPAIVPTDTQRKTGLSSEQYMFIAIQNSDGRAKLFAHFERPIAKATKKRIIYFVHRNIHTGHDEVINRLMQYAGVGPSLSCTPK